jgi:hypothetical protein
MKTILIVSTWLSAMGPTVSVQTVDNMDSCHVAAQASADAVKAQARSNLTWPHGDLLLEIDTVTRDVTLRTPSVGREVARFRCLIQVAQKNSLT